MTGLFTEETRYDPSSPYSASKAASDHLVRAYARTYGMRARVTNCSNNYGPLQFPEKLIPLMILNCLDRKPLPVYGKGENIRDWLYVTDHCEAIWRVIEAGKDGETYNIGGHNEVKNIDVVRAPLPYRREPDGRTRGRDPGADHVRAGSSGARSALRDRREQDRARARLDPTRDVRDRPGEDRALVHPELRMGGSSVRSGDYRKWLEKNYAGRSPLERRERT